MLAHAKSGATAKYLHYWAHVAPGTNNTQMLVRDKGGKEEAERLFFYCQFHFYGLEWGFITNFTSPMWPQWKLPRFFLRSKVGSLGEAIGVRYLKKKGYRVRETNYCNSIGRRLGEIDIVAEKEGKIIFVEVKTRLKGKSGSELPEASITREKLRRLERIALCYIRERKVGSQPYSFDALSILYDENTKKAEIRHLPSIFIE